jgi:hypothetical protein
MYRVVRVEKAQHDDSAARHDLCDVEEGTRRKDAIRVNSVQQTLAKLLEGQRGKKRKDPRRARQCVQQKE